MIRVLIPNHGHDQYLPIVIRSLASQECRYSVINDYPRMGKGFRMNTVVPYVQEEWLNVHDADDMSRHNRFRVCSDYFNDYDVIYHDIFVWDGLAWKSRRAGEWDRERYKRESYICASSILVRTEIAQKVKWQTNTYGQDWIWLNLIAKYTDRFKYIPVPLLYYRGQLGFTKRLKFKTLRRFLLRRKIARLVN